MIQTIKDEILSGNPRYTIQDDRGQIIEDDVQITLKTTVTQEGTPINKVLFENLQGDLYTQDRYNVPSYSGTTMTLSIPLKSYETNKIVRIKSPSNFTNPTLNINKLGAKTVQGELQANQYYDLVYDGTKFIAGKAAIGVDRTPVVITASGTYTINKNFSYKVVLVGGGGGSAFFDDNTTNIGAGGAGGYAEGIYVPMSDTISVEIGKGGANAAVYLYGRTAEAEDGGNTIFGEYIAYGGTGATAASSQNSTMGGGDGLGYFSKKGASGVIGDGYANRVDNGWEINGTKYGSGGYIYQYKGSIQEETDGKDGVVIFYPL